MLFFGDDKNLSLSQGIASYLSTTPIYPDIAVFSDGERRVRLTKNVVGQKVVFLKTSSATSNIDSQVMETAFLIDALKRSGAKTITGVIPHFPYARGDHLFGDGESVPLEVVIGTFEAAGLSKIIFVDPHTIKMKEMFKIPAISISAVSVFAEKIKELGFDPKNSVLVSPDIGGLRRVKALSDHLEKASFICLEKKRDHITGKIKMGKMDGKVVPNCYVIDDEIASGGTIVTALKQLKEQGAKKIYVFATHAVFSGQASILLESSPAEKIILTDSIPVPKEKRFNKLEILCLAELIGKKL